MYTLTLQTLKEHENSLKQGNTFPTGANETVNILKSYKADKHLRMDDETRKYLEDLLKEYGDKYFMLEDE